MNKIINYFNNPQKVKL